MNAVLIARITENESALAKFCPSSYSLARPINLATMGPLIHRDALKDLIDCDCLGSYLTIWDGLQITIWCHDDDGELVGEEVEEREVACEITTYDGYEVVGVLEGPLVVTGAVTAEGVKRLSADDAQSLADRINAGTPLRGLGDMVYTFTDLLVLSEPLEPGGGPG
jgi:hypothetical protein